MLASGDVQVKSGSRAKDIKINAALSWTSSNQLTLDSYRSIAFDKPVVVAGSGTVAITTNDGGSDGDFSFNGKGHIEFWDLSSEPIVNGQRYALAGNLAKLVKLARHSPFIALANTINASRQSFTTSPIGSINGTIEGFGNAISNFHLVDTTPSDVCVGMVGCTDPGSSPIFRDIEMKAANVTGTQTGQQVGALAGANYGLMIGCSVSGEVTATGQRGNAGGLAGSTSNAAMTRRSFSTASVSATGPQGAAGGLVGEDTGAIQESFATGTVTAGDGAAAGGLVGILSEGAISDSYATGAVSGGASSVTGGFAGSSMTGVHIASSYSLGNVSGGSGATIGGFVGEDTTNAGLSGVYWDLDTSGISDTSRGAGNIANDPGITGLTTAQLLSGLPGGFSSSVWAEKATVNGGYPYLIDQPGK
jgi:hypothetical protein